MPDTSFSRRAPSSAPAQAWRDPKTIPADGPRRSGSPVAHDSAVSIALATRVGAEWIAAARSLSPVTAAQTERAAATFPQNAWVWVIAC